MDNQLYDYSPIIERAPLELPDGKRLAFWIGLNVEHFEVAEWYLRSQSLGSAG